METAGAGEQELEVRFLEESDAPAMRALFKEVFNQEMREAFWRWKYRPGERPAVGVFRAGELISHYGGAGLHISYKGRPARAVQICDVMVKPAARQAARRKGAFYLAGHHFAEHTVGYDRPYLLGFGFPNERAMRVAEQAGLYARVGSMLEANWETAGQEPGTAWLQRVVEINASNFDAHAAGLETLWQALREDLREHIVVRKDAAWLRHRYLENPDKQYRLFLLYRRFTGRPLGLVVLKVEDDKVLLMDCVGSLAALPALLRLARRETALLHRTRLYTWCSAAFAQYFSATGATLRELGVIIPATTRMPGPKPEELQDHWWLLPGDTDFL